ncbi:MAG: dihydroorotase [Ginsengibacter sp.]
MKVLIKNALIVCNSSPFNGKNQDILIDKGVIASIKESINDAADQIIEIEGLNVSIGWTDLFANFADPGYEFKETLESGAKAAAAGGFTSVAIIPNTKPVVDSKSQVEYIKQKSNLPINILPLGSITKEAAGKELSEMYDMRTSGSVAFTDGTYSIQTSGILLKALQYVKAFDGLIIQLPEDKTITNNGLVNEGIVSTSLGLPGKPAIAEEIMVSRDIELLRYTNSRLHITGITTGKSVDLIRNAKREGLNVTCSVTPYHLYFTDNDLLDYDTNLKVNPPLREKDDVEKLKDGLKDGTIDFIASHHQPHEWDSKITEFEYAKNGMSGIETVFSVCQAIGIPTARFIEMQTTHIRKALALLEGGISEGGKADLTLFVPGVDNIYKSEGSRSKSRNNAFIGKSLKGKVIGIINGDKLFLNEN